MDGNGRWAAARGLPVAEGHREGARALRRTVEAAIDLGVESLAVYAFSTENWARPPDEVESIMELMDETIDRELPDLAKQGVRTRFFGRRDRVPEALQEKMARLEAETAHNDRLEPLDRLRLRQPSRARRGGAAARRGRGQTPGRVRRRPSRSASMRPSSPTPISSSAPRASSGSRTSCSGSRRTRSSSSTRRSGRTSARNGSGRRSTSTRSADAGSARDEQCSQSARVRQRKGLRKPCFLP